MIPTLSERHVLILEYLARFRRDVRSGDPQPWNITADGIVHALHDCVAGSSAHKCLRFMNVAGLVDRHTCWVAGAPPWRASSQTARSRMYCYQITDDGLALLEGYRKVYDKELQMAVGKR